MACDRIRVGGTISGSTLSGGTVIESQAIGLVDWSAIYSHPGFKGQDWQPYGADGFTYRPRKRYNARYMTLSVAAWNRDAAGSITSPDGACGELADNIDLLMGLFDGEGEQFILERDQPDGTTRWIRGQLAGPATGVPGPLFTEAHAAYTFVLPIVCAYPFWQSEAEHSTTLSGADSLVQAGNARIANATLVFAGDGTLTADGDTVEVSGSAAAVTVNVGARSVTMSGGPADNVFTADQPWWLTFGPGTTTTSGTASVTVTYRDSFLA